MKILEFGDTSKRKIILIHGFQCPWQVWNKYIEYYEKKFHIIVLLCQDITQRLRKTLYRFCQMREKSKIICFHIMGKMYIQCMVCQWEEY